MPFPSRRPLTPCRKSVAPGDDFVVAIAVAGRADLVDTLDYDLLALVEHGGVRFVKPRAALTAIRESGDGKGSH